MRLNSDQNEDIDENDELVVTDHRDVNHPIVEPEQEPDVETAGLSPREALDELGEDVASSPAKRGRPVPERHEPPDDS